MADGAVDEDMSGRVKLLDPYAYQPGVVSKIGGLAQGQLGHDVNYVFHTDYVSVGRGIAHARIRFTGLRAKIGVLQIRIHMLTGGDEGRLMLMNGARIALGRLIHQGSEISIPFEGFVDCRYAVYGAILGDTDAVAEELTIAIDLPQSDDHVGLDTEARNSRFGQDAVQGSAQMVSSAEPSMRSPVSQLATGKQMTSSTAQSWLAELGRGKANDLDAWSAVYTMQALQRYGSLGEGARGLGLGTQETSFVETLARKGCAISIADPAHRERDGSPEQRGPGGVDIETLGTTLVNFDFLWSWDPDGRIASREQWSAGIERALTSLLPGGLAVFTFGFDPEIAARRVETSDEPHRIGRAELEQLALILISRQHQVAQIRVGSTQPLVHMSDDPRHSACGLIVRRSTLPE